MRTLQRSCKKQIQKMTLKRTPRTIMPVKSSMMFGKVRRYLASRSHVLMPSRFSRNSTGIWACSQGTSIWIVILGRMERRLMAKYGSVGWSLRLSWQILSKLNEPYSSSKGTVNSSLIRTACNRCSAQTHPWLRASLFKTPVMKKFLLKMMKTLIKINCNLGIIQALQYINKIP